MLLRLKPFNLPLKLPGLLLIQHLLPQKLLFLRSHLSQEDSMQMLVLIKVLASAWATHDTRGREDSVGHSASDAESTPHVHILNIVS